MGIHRFIPWIVFVCISVMLARFSEAANWPMFRGPIGTGHVKGDSLPVKWDAKSIVWKTKLNGVGQSSPVTWGNRIFVTSATGNGKTRSVICLDRSKGQIVWEKSIECAAPEKTHGMNGWATPSCATDGERVVAFFGAGGLHCYDLKGIKQWSRDLGSFPSNWGAAASPLILDNMVIQNYDAVGPSYLIALDKKNGEQIWKTKRRDKPRGGWSTPIVAEVEKKREIILNGQFGVAGYDPADGKELWFCKAFNGRGSPMPEFAGGKVFVVGGQPGDTYCVRPGGSGDVTQTHMAWHAKRIGGRDLPSPIVLGNYLFVTSMSGIASCYSTSDGKILWTERLGNKMRISASPMEAKGLIYIQAESGETIVVKAGASLKIVSRNTLGETPGEIFRSTLVPSNGRVLIRSSHTLYCVK